MAFGGDRPQFDAERLESSNGAAILEWSGDADRFEAQVSSEPGFGDAKTFYQGRMPSAQISGLYDGTYHFRVRSMDGEEPGLWSDSTQLVVEHHPMGLVWSMFAIGGLVFVATAGFVGQQLLRPRGGS